ncbi:ABC transporter substrate-binding protein [Salinicoccus luteus]|uniref:ABC transporter substrate-binding protein n=1 Tax=Salinicoccus luteus TaxID=367840 RepID=UPI0004E15C02|nr:ABC transporter substrate-binding protein [Salinicoccus luteus]
MMDKRLLILKRYLEKYGQDFTHLSEALNVSPRQLSRILRQWDGEGYIEYIPGHGRGLKTRIKLNMDIERELFKEMNRYRDELSIEEFNKYLELPWHAEYIESIRKIIEHGHNAGSADSTAMMDYLYKVPETFTPALSIEHASMLIGLQVFETLYKSEGNKKIRVYLLRYDEWRGNELHLFLKGGIQFSDGEILDSTHVKSVLEILKNESVYTDTFQIIGEVKIYDSLHLSLEVENASLLIKYYLAEPISAIFKFDKKGNTVGTGPYKIEKYNGRSVILSENKHHTFGLPDVKRLYLIANESKIEKYQRNNFGKTYSHENYMWNNFILFNPLENRLSFEQRSYLKRIFLEAVYNGRTSENNLYRKVSDFIPGERMITPKFDFPIKVMLDELNPTISNDIRKKLDESDVEVEYIEMDMKTYLETDLKDLDVDMVLMKESYHQSHPWQLIDLLTHCKFREWYGEIEEMKRFLNMNHESDRAAGEMSQEILKHINDSVYIVHLFKKYRRVLLPVGLKNIVEMDYGAVDYSKIIATG